MNKLSSLAQIRNYAPKPLSPQTHQALLKGLSKFKASQDYSHMAYTHAFEADSLPFILEKMSKIGCIADEMGHHPEWTLRDRQLEVRLSTHDIGNRLSVKDYILASWVEKVLAEESLEKQLCQEWNGKSWKLDELQ